MTMIRAKQQHADAGNVWSETMPKVIGLVHHYPVSPPSRPSRCDAEQYARWCDHYNSADVRLPEVPPFPMADWDICLSSDMRRAAHTIRHLWGEGNPIVYSSALREVEIAPFCQTKLKLPHQIWSAIGRAAWYTSHRSQPETLQQTRARAAAIVDHLHAFGSDQRVLIVSHGLFLRVLRQELRKRGYRSSRASSPHGRIGEPSVWKRSAGSRIIK
ncbi:histidine phosphatase family protein (plasmid) [Paenibacillus cellulosilyticus]|nr:histidine phosphatase family protein [Paenibacillus cellulosilyticus]QKS48459.1 histidine phosphatase family protein [Paenibacillus cellulosilyticus]